MRGVGGQLVESHSVGAIQAEVVGMLVVRQRARHLGLLVYHLSVKGGAVIKQNFCRRLEKKNLLFGS